MNLQRVTTGSFKQLRSRTNLSRCLLTSTRMAAEAPLQTQKCEPCTSSMPALSRDQASQLLSSLEGKWTLSSQPKTLLSSKLEHPEALHRTYKFKDYLTAQKFATDVAELAESEGHHPAVMVEWGRATVWWWSHAIKGVSGSVLPLAVTCMTNSSAHLHSCIRMISSWLPKPRILHNLLQDIPHQNLTHSRAAPAGCDLIAIMHVLMV